MVTLDRIRLTGLLKESPAKAGLSHWLGRCESGMEGGMQEAMDLLEDVAISLR
jgi:hypothetical protein